MNHGRLFFSSCLNIPIIYLEPFSGRNLRAFGYDMFSEPVRRMAMERARDMDAPVLSGKVILVQETDQDIQVGTLMYVPVYHKMITDTIEQRQAALNGWVYSPYRMNDLMQGILSGWDLEDGKRIRLQIFNSSQLSAESLLYDSQPKEEVTSASSARLTRCTSLSLYGQNWHLQFTRKNGQLNYGAVYGYLSTGAIICVLMFSLVISLLNTRFRVQELADHLTKDLRESEDKLFKLMREQQIILENANVGISMTVGRKQVWLNQKTIDLFQYAKEEMKGKTTQMLYPSQEVYEQFASEGYPVLSEGRVYVSDQTLIRQDGTPVLVRLNGKAIDPPDLSQGIIWLLEDVTERMQAAEELRESEARFRKLFELNAAVKLIINPETGKIIEANKAASDFYGWSIAELTRMCIQDINTLPVESVKSQIDETVSSEATRYLP